MFDNKFNSKAILYVIFLLSGATGLVYEVIWVRLTGLVFGIVDSVGSRFYPVGSQLHYSSDPYLFHGGHTPRAHPLFHGQRPGSRTQSWCPLRPEHVWRSSGLAPGGAGVHSRPWQPENDSDHRFGQRGDRIVRHLAVRALAGRSKRG